MHDTIELPSTLDPPFLAPLECVLDLPVPPSVNTTRRFNGAGVRKLAKWKEHAGMRVMAGGGLRRLTKMPGKFEAILTLDEDTCRLDLDNAAKHAIDFARTLGLVQNDDKRFMRRVTIEWGKVPGGCRLILRSVA